MARNEVPTFSDYVGDGNEGNEFSFHIRQAGPLSGRPLSSDAIGVLLARESDGNLVFIPWTSIDWIEIQ